MPYGLSEDDIGQVWLSIALHTTPGVPKHLRPSVSLVTAGAEMDVLAMDYAAFSSVQREAVVHAHPRGEGFKECVIGAFADGLRHRPQMTFGNVKTDVLVDQEPGFKPLNFVEVIRQSPWTAWNKNVGAGLLANAVGQTTFQSTDTPSSRASTLPHFDLGCS